MSKMNSLFITLFAAGLLSCRNHKNNPTILTGNETRVASENVSPGGGQVVVDKPGDPLDGLTIDIPADAYKEAKTFVISESPVTSHGLGPAFNPVSPLITISNGGGHAGELMTLTIPVHITPEQFAMAFLYDDKTGKLEGLPLLESNEEYVVVAVSDFSHSSSSGSGLAAQAGGQDREYSKVVLTAEDERKLSGEFNTGFTPGVDDMPCQNIGTSVSPNGICNGKSLAALWYYCNKKTLRRTGLNKMLDNDGNEPTPNFTNDDSKALKLSSMMQQDYTIWGGVKEAFIGLFSLGVQMVTPDRITKNAFAYAIKLTGEPQFMAIYSTSPGMAGHALIVYRVHGNNLYVCDPSFQGREKMIVFDDINKEFNPYRSAEKSTDDARDYTSFFYMAKSAMMSWPTAAKHWKDLENGQVGKDRFPDFSIQVMNREGDMVPLEDGFETGEDGNMTLAVRTPGFNNRFTVCDEAGNLLLIDSDSPNFKVPPGKHKIGINVLDRKTTYWAGFKWVWVKAPERNKEEKKFPPPDFADMDVALKINGVPASSGRSNFSIDGSNLLLRIPLNVAPETPVRLYLQLDDWKGEGEYNSLKGFVELLKFDPPGQCSIESSHMKVTKWRDGELVCSFTLTCVCNATPCTIEGQFSYRDSWMDVQ